MSIDFLILLAILITGLIVGILIVLEIPKKEIKIQNEFKPAVLVITHE